MGGTVAKRGRVSCSCSHRQNLNPGLSDSRTAALNHWIGVMNMFHFKSQVH